MSKDANTSKVSCEGPVGGADQTSASDKSSMWDVQQGPMTNRKNRAILASFWVSASVASSYVTRLISTLVLTRLLFPEVFGLIAFVTIVMQVLNMFSDVGLNVAVLRSKRVDEPFINCAWTLRLLRGLGIWVAAAAFAWPVSLFFEQPALVGIIPVVALSSIIDPFGSPAIWFCNRRLHLWPMFWRDSFVNVAALMMKIILAIHLQSVWAIVYGGLFASVLRVMTSYWIFPEIRPRLVWDKGVVKELFSFGGWLFASSVLAFVVQQGDRLVLGKLFDAEVLGIYVIAMTIPMTIINLAKRMDSTVLLPVYADLVHYAKKRLRRRVLQSRTLLIFVGVAPSCMLAIFGQQVIDLLFDSRYASAGWMLQVSSAGIVALLINISAASIALPAGDSRGLFVFQLVKGILFIAGMLVGGWVYGFVGLVAGVGVSHFLAYPAAAWLARRHGVWHFGLDMAAYLIAACTIGIGWTMFGLPRAQ